ncbi:tRNA (cytidine(34)-2'-O)-methyltransferase [Leucobacter sp. 7(1)]|uniref:tRNA (cytidine(34)-2'-O)-methyltransferase n=1 Tax=Leucobacter sp. 7(1) TaxID=1255613 RepID=UPI00097EDC14|nr:tRNA (cytidine(34)-2'-O)-methyltransferase [Leucobacter sp. 7(1)]SJN09933.1 tRNA (cytidine(34)-2'-O)-methyltransferase [Leucobacter sp. 7(1)]
MTRILLFEPRIAGNTGNVIRMAAGSGAELHLVNPLFDFEDAKLRRAGLDYHDLAIVQQHDSFDAAMHVLQPARVFAFTARTERSYTDVSYEPNDVLLFGPEPTGLSEEILMHEAVTDRLRVPMLPGRRSMNLANCVAVATYEAWRQQGFPGAGTETHT